MAGPGFWAVQPLCVRVASLPTDRHIRYWQQRYKGQMIWTAFWWDDAGRRRKRTLGPVLPPDCPDWPCQHPEKRSWQIPTTEAERQEAIERGRRANALRKVRSNQYRKRAG